MPTGELNAFLGELVAEHPTPVRSGKQPKIMFAHPARRRAAAVRAVHLGPLDAATSASSSAGCARSSASRYADRPAVKAREKRKRPRTQPVNRRLPLRAVSGAQPQP